jgi:hypothetical protein
MYPVQKIWKFYCSVIRGLIQLTFLTVSTFSYHFYDRVSKCYIVSRFLLLKFLQALLIFTIHATYHAKPILDYTVIISGEE